MTSGAIDALDLAAFESLAATFAESLSPGDIVALEGDLGAGKTTFVAAAVRALGSSDDVSSPTFTFWHRYRGRVPVEHVDLYRIEMPEEASELGLHEALAPGGIAFVEWPQRLPGFVPPGALRVEISGAGSGPRRVSIERR